MSDPPSAVVDVSIVIVSYRSLDVLRTCLESVYRETAGVSFEVTVVENASGDGTAEMVRTEFPAVTVLELSRNVGFARGSNLGAESAVGEYILLLNPDTEITSGAIQRLVEFARARPLAGIYGGRTLQPDGRLNPHSCMGRISLWSVTCFGLGLSAVLHDSPLFNPEGIGGWQRDTVRQVEMVAGCFMLVDRGAWRGLGGFDERFFMYGEDADFAIRAAKRGFRPLITPDATIVHHLGASSHPTDRVVMVMACRGQLIRTHWSRPSALVGTAMLKLGVALRSGARRLAGTHLGQSTQWQDVWRRRAEWEHGPRSRAGCD